MRARAGAWWLVVLLSGAVWPLAGYGFANAQVGATIRNRALPTLDGGSAELLAANALANVFVFFRPQQEHSADTLKAMAACEKEFAGKPVRFVAVVSGSWPKEVVRAAVAESGIRMPVLVDEGDALYGELGVRLHPSIGIADGAGKLLAYEPFRKIHYCDVVRVRVQHALKEIGAADVERVVDPGRAPMPDEVAGAPARRNVKMGQMLLRSRSWDKAAEAARQAIQKDPASAEAHLLLADALAGKGECGAAAAEYAESERLAPGSSAASEWRRACAAAPAADPPRR